MKVVLTEEQKNNLKLEPFIYKAILNKSTSLGDNPAIPPYGDFGLEYHVVKNKFEEVSEIIDRCIENGKLESKDPDYLVSVLSQKIVECKQKEEPIRPQLQKLCENMINSIFAIPVETVLLECKLIDEVKPEKNIRVLPEDFDEFDENAYNFEDVEEVELANKAILKRRFINCLIQGLSYWLSTDIDDWCDAVVELDKDVWNLWFDIIHISDYLLFVRNEKIDEKHPKLMSYVEVKLGRLGKKTSIKAQGVIFPYLLRDTIRGFLELFSSHGLPNDTQKAMYVVRKADFLVAEPWDLRLGMGIIDMLHTSLTKIFQSNLLFTPQRIPYFFKMLCSLKIDEFNSVMKNFLLHTNKGKIIAKEFDDSIDRNIDYQKFKDRIQQKNINTSVINDGDFSKEELDGYVLQENETDEMMAYHGTSADFNKFNHKKFLNTGAGSQSFGWGTYVTDDKEVANGYVEAAKGNGERDFFLNLNPKPYLESLMKYDEEMINDILEAYRHYAVATFRDGMEPTYEYVMNSLTGLIEWKENDLNIYLPPDKVIKMYNEDPRFSNMSVEEKNKAIENHKIRYAEKERPVKIFKACADILTHFKPEMDEFLKNRFAYLYEVEIPDDDGFNYIFWYDKPTLAQQKTIDNKLLELGKKYNRKIGQIYNYISGSKLYEDLAEYFSRLLNDFRGKGEKAASLFLMQCGFDGIKYPAGTRWQKPDGASEDAMNYVIFDANKVKIVNKTRT